MAGRTRQILVITGPISSYLLAAFGQRCDGIKCAIDRLLADAVNRGRHIELYMAGLNLAPRGVEERLFSISDLVAINRGDKWADDTLAGLGRYEPGRTIGEYRIFVARSDAPRPADPDAAVQRILRWDQMSPLEWRWAKDPG